jgi:hypothetical protein
MAKTRKQRGAARGKRATMTLGKRPRFMKGRNRAVYTNIFPPQNNYKNNEYYQHILRAKHVLYAIHSKHTNPPQNYLEAANRLSAALPEIVEAARVAKIPEIVKDVTINRDPFMNVLELSNVVDELIIKYYFIFATKKRAEIHKIEYMMDYIYNEIEDVLGVVRLEIAEKSKFYNGNNGNNRNDELTKMMLQLGL